MIVGGKGANLGELSMIDGILVPEGFVFLQKLLKESLRKHHQLTNYFISYRILR